MAIDPDGPYGINTKMREDQARSEARERKEKDDAWKRLIDSSKPKTQTSNTWGTTSSSTTSKIICNEAVRQNMLSRADLLISHKYVRENLTPTHERGYHYWAVSVVGHMRSSERVAKFWAKLARARANHIAYLYGDNSRRDFFGHILCAAGHPTCLLIGKIVGQQNWQKLYQNT